MGASASQARSTPSWARVWLDQWLADQGFLVVKFDGRGTPLRSAAWKRAVKYDFATIPLEDQVTALRALAQKVPEMDLSRVGIYGWSHGGYMSAKDTVVSIDYRLHPRECQAGPAKAPHQSPELPMAPGPVSLWTLLPGRAFAGRRSALLLEACPSTDGHRAAG